MSFLTHQCETVREKPVIQRAQNNEIFVSDPEVFLPEVTVFSSGFPKHLPSSGKVAFSAQLSLSLALKAASSNWSSLFAGQRAALWPQM